MARAMYPTAQTTVLLVLFASAAASQTPQTPTTTPNRDIPDFTVQIWGDTAADFTTRVVGYAELRSHLEQGLVGLTMTEDPAEIERAEVALAGRIAAARSRARQGEIFTPAIGKAFKKALILEMNAVTWGAIMDDNPGQFTHQVNRTYPKTNTVSTVPPNILDRLPALPDDIQYRFLGRYLILLDTRANLIIDRLTYAIRCANCDQQAP